MQDHKNDGPQRLQTALFVCRYKHCIMIGLIRLTKMQAVSLTCCIVIANHHFPFFRAYCFACNDTKVVIKCYKHCNLTEISLWTNMLTVRQWFIQFYYNVLLNDHVHYLWCCTYVMALMKTIWYEFLLYEIILTQLLGKWLGPTFSSPAVWSIIFMVMHLTGLAFSVAFLCL